MSNSRIGMGGKGRSPHDRGSRGQVQDSAIKTSLSIHDIGDERQDLESGFTLKLLSRMQELSDAPPDAHDPIPVLETAV